jgi:hypothetical protein
MLLNCLGLDANTIVCWRRMTKLERDSFSESSSH